MKIAYYSHYFTPEIGAPSARIQEFSRVWIDMGHRVQVATCFPNHPGGKLYPGYRPKLYSREKIDGIDVHRHWTYITPNKGFIRKTLGHASYYPSALLLSNRRMELPDVTIGTSPTFFAAMAASAKASACSIPFVMEIRDLWPAIFVQLGILRNSLIIRALERWELSLYRKAHRIVTVTEAFRDNLIRRGIPADKVHTIVNGADVSFWQPSDVAAKANQKFDLGGRFVVLYLGAHGISQALGSVLDCACALREETRILFLFVGDGAEKMSLVRRAKEERLENVRFLDPVNKSEARDLYAVADVCLVPLRDIPLFESFLPSKMFEIMAAGRPIIGGVRGEAAAILARSGGAMLVTPEDGADLAHAIRQLHSRPEEARAMGQQARKFVVNHYCRRSLAVRYAQMLEEIVREYPGSAK